MVKGCSFHADIFDENKLPLGEKTFSVKLPNAEEEGVASPSVFHLLLDSQALGILSEKAPSIDIFGLQHLVVVIMLVIMHHLAAVFISPQIQ